MFVRQPRSTRPATPFPYTTLFRSILDTDSGILDGLYRGHRLKLDRPVARQLADLRFANSDDGDVAIDIGREPGVGHGYIASRAPRTSGMCREARCRLSSARGSRGLAPRRAAVLRAELGRGEGWERVWPN